MQRPLDVFVDFKHLHHRHTAAIAGLAAFGATHGVVKVIDEETMTEICEVAAAAAPATTNVLVAEEQWLFGSATTALFSYRDGTCGSSDIPAYQIDVPITDTPPITDGVIWAPADGLILPIGAADSIRACEPRGDHHVPADRGGRVSPRRRIQKWTERTGGRLDSGFSGCVEIRASSTDENAAGRRKRDDHRCDRSRADRHRRSHWMKSDVVSGWPLSRSL